jgi:hypothetical protein
VRDAIPHFTLMIDKVRVTATRMAEDYVAAYHRLSKTRTSGASANSTSMAATA